MIQEFSVFPLIPKFSKHIWILNSVASTYKSQENSMSKEFTRLQEVLSIGECQECFKV